MSPRQRLLGMTFLVMSLSACTGGLLGLGGAGKTVTGTVAGKKVGPTTMVELKMVFGNIVTVKDEPVPAISAPVLNGAYTLVIPAPPGSTIRGGGSLVAFNDANGNKTWDKGEAYLSNAPRVEFIVGQGYTVSKTAIVFD